MRLAMRIFDEILSWQLSWNKSCFLFLFFFCQMQCGSGSEAWDDYNVEFGSDFNGTREGEGQNDYQGDQDEQCLQ